jgi:hypothetical protein
MATPSLLCLRGELVVVGKSPDGDSIRFIPTTPSLLARLPGGERVHLSEDGSVQLRLDAIDTPETHYENHAQPLGQSARDELLAFCGFTDVHWSGGAVVSATPERVPAAGLANLVDVNGRPIVLLLVGRLPRDGASTRVTPALLARTANAALTTSGRAYGTFYTSTAPEIVDALRTRAQAARDARRGVWDDDASAGFELRSQASIGPAGSLILPKLFRRCTDYLRDRMTGETLPEWLRRHQSGQNPEDDEVQLAGRTVRLSDLIRQDGRRISLEADPLELLFVG